MIVLSVDPREKELEEANDNRNVETAETVPTSKEVNEEDLEEINEDEEQ